MNPLIITGGGGGKKKPTENRKALQKGGTRGPRTEEGGGEGEPTLAANPAVPGRKRRSQIRQTVPATLICASCLNPLGFRPCASVLAASSCRRNGPRCQPHGREGEISHPGYCSPRSQVLSRSCSGDRASGPCALPVRPCSGGKGLGHGTLDGLDQRQGAGGEGTLTNLHPPPLVFAPCPHRAGRGQDLCGGAEGQWARALPAPQPFPDTTPFRGNASGCG